MDEEWTPCLVDDRHDTNSRVCHPCRSNLLLKIVELPHLYYKLEDELHFGSGASGEVVSGTKNPRKPPCRVDVLTLRGPASDGSPEGEQVGISIVGVLRDWEADWRQQQGLSPVTPLSRRSYSLYGASSVQQAVEDSSRFLATHLPWACNSHPVVDEFARDMSDLGLACKRALGLIKPKTRIGRCPTPVGDGQLCGAHLKIDPMTRESVVCDACGASWGWLDLPDLGQQLGAR